jgi:hypothetical protein
MTPDALSHEEDGSITQSEDFNYAEVERALGEFDKNELTEAEWGMAGKGVRALIEWLWQVKSENREGLLIRATILSWVMLDYLHDGMNLTEMAAHMNKDKQSLGRWVDDFKTTFPMIKTPHMK